MINLEHKLKRIEEYRVKKRLRSRERYRKACDEKRAAKIDGGKIPVDGDLKS